MSSLDERKLALAQNPYAEKTAWALARIAEQERTQQAYGHGLMFMFAEFEEATTGTSPIARAAQLSKWFCIWFAMIVPVVAMWNVVY